MRRLLLVLALVLGLADDTLAAITFVGGGANWGFGTVTITEPAGVAQHDGGVCYAVLDSTNTLTTPSGWTQVDQRVINAVNVYLYSLADRGSGAATTLSFVPASSNYLEVDCMWVRGHNTTTILDGTPVYTANQTGPNPDPDAITVTTAGNMVVAIGNNWDSGGAWTSPTGYSNMVRLGGGTDDLGMTSKITSSSGSEDPGAFGGAAGGSATVNAVTVSIAQAGGGGGGGSTTTGTLLLMGVGR